MMEGLSFLGLRPQARKELRIMAPRFLYMVSTPRLGMSIGPSKRQVIHAPQYLHCVFIIDISEVSMLLYIRAQAEFIHPLLLRLVVYTLVVMMATSSNCTQPLEN